MPLPTAPPVPVDAPLAAQPYDAEGLVAAVAPAIATWPLSPQEQRESLRATQHLSAVLTTCAGATLQARWETFEQTVWPRWVAGEARWSPNRWTWGVRAVVLARLVRPGWPLLSAVRVSQWVARLPAADPLVQQRAVLSETMARGVTWASAGRQAEAVNLGLRLLLRHGHTSVQQLTEAALHEVPRGDWGGHGADVLDAALCWLGVLARSPQRGTSRHARRPRRSVAELVAIAGIPTRFAPVTILYLEAYAVRISDVYATLRHKVSALAHFWRFVAEQCPEIQRCADVRPEHGQRFLPYALERARQLQRAGRGEATDRTTAHAWLIEVRGFFADLSTWATEPGSPLADHAPRSLPLTRHDLTGLGFEQARRRQQARLTATVLDLARELPKIRAYAFRQWQSAQAARGDAAMGTPAERAERVAFWDWALLELLVQTGLRIEEASELTTLDILKRQLPDGRVYYLLHVKPSKFDRARVLPIGDSVGHVLAEIMRHVKRFYGTHEVPCCDHWDTNEKRLLPRAPYLLQGAKHPSPLGITTIRERLRRLARAAEARHADGSPLVLLPHDCRRVFASEHLNNQTPVHVIQALLGHATLDTVMVYAKLYPTHLVEAYRQALRAAYTTFHGPASLRNPTAAEWAAFTAQCHLRDMGTHLCALPTGEHCPKGLVCLGCVHAQPKRSAAPLFRRMLGSHERALARARGHGEPAGQIAARELEVERLQHALRRAEELTEDVAAAIESATDEPATKPVRDHPDAATIPR